MKKLLALLLVLVMCFSCIALTACNCGGNDDVPPIKDAVTMLKGMLDSKKTVTESFKVPTKLGVNGSTFTVAWTVDNATITLTDDGAMKVVNIPATNAAEFSFTLTAKITSPSGETKDANWSIKVPVKTASAGDNVAENTAYKLYVLQNTLGKRLYALNALDSSAKYITTTDDPKLAADYYVEKSGEGYKFYTMNGEAKSYIEAYVTSSGENKWSKKLRFTEDAAAASVWFWETAGEGTNKEGTKAWFTQCSASSLWYTLGTYGTFNTLSISDESFMTAAATGVSQYPAAFVPKAEAEAEAPDEGATLPTTPEGILDAAFALADGASLPGNVTLTGVISKIDTPYDSGYENVSVTIVVGGDTERALLCYRLKGTGADVITVGDTITVTGLIKNYGGIIEFNSGCTLDSYTAHSHVDANTDNKCDICEGSMNGEEGGEEGGETPAETSTIAEVIASADKTAIVTEGVVVAIASNQFVVKDATGAVLVYTTPTDLALGDKITISGTKDSYNKGAQIGSATWTKNGTETVDHGTALTPTVAELETMKAESAITAVYLTFEGTLSISGNYYNIVLDGTTATQGSILKITGDLKTAADALNGKTVVVTGYFVNVSSGKYVNVVLTAISEKAVDGGETGGEEGGEEPETPTTYSCADANGLAVGAKATVTGTVTYINGKNMTITDSTGSFNFYNLTNTSSIGLGDVITVTGTISAYNSANQISGATATIDTDHSASDACVYPETGLTAVCTICDAVNPEHTECADSDSDSKCDACGAVYGLSYTEYTGTVSLVHSGTTYYVGVLDGSWVLASTDAANAATITVSLGSDGASAKIKIGDTFIAPSGGNKNGIKGGEYVWKYAVNDDGTYSFFGQGDDTVTLAFNGSSDYLKIRAYKNTTVSDTATYITNFAFTPATEA